MLGRILLFILKIHQGPKTCVSHHDNIGTPATITTIRSTCWHVLFPPKGNCTVTTIACLDKYSSLVYKHSYTPFFKKWAIENSIAHHLYYSAISTGYILTFFLFLSNLSNLTFPSTSANRVSSPPFPTFVPG